MKLYGLAISCALSSSSAAAAALVRPSVSASPVPDEIADAFEYFCFFIYNAFVLLIFSFSANPFFHYI